MTPDYHHSCWSTCISVKARSRDAISCTSQLSNSLIRKLYLCFNIIVQRIAWHKSHRDTSYILTLGFHSFPLLKIQKKILLVTGLIKGLRQVKVVWLKGEGATFIVCGTSQRGWMVIFWILDALVEWFDSRKLFLTGKSVEKLPILSL